MVTENLLEKWEKDSTDTPEDYQPEVCPPEQAENWTNTENPGNSESAAWEWDLLVDLAYIADSNPTTIRENVEDLITGLTEEDGSSE